MFATLHNPPAACTRANYTLHRSLLQFAPLGRFANLYESLLGWIIAWRRAEGPPLMDVRRRYSRRCVITELLLLAFHLGVRSCMYGSQFALLTWKDNYAFCVYILWLKVRGTAHLKYHDRHCYRWYIEWTTVFTDVLCNSYTRRSWCLNSFIFQKFKWNSYATLLGIPNSNNIFRHFNPISYRIQCFLSLSWERINNA